MHIILDSRGIKRNLLVAYQNLFMQQYAYFGGTSKKIVYGCTSEDELLTTSEVCPGTTDISYELRVNKNISYESVLRLYRKYGYNVKDLSEMQVISATDQCNTNMIFASCFYINEYTKDLKVDKYRNPNELMFMSKSKEGLFKQAPQLHEVLQVRNRMLPKQGV